MSRKRILALAGLVVLVIAVAGYLVAARRPPVLEGSGTVEARNIRVGSKVGGRIHEVRVREGDRVEPGQVLVTFEDQELAATVEQARARTAQAHANLDKMQRGYRREEIAQAQADLDRVRAEAENAESTWKRAQQLAAEGVFSRQQRDDAQAAHESAVARVRSAEQRAAELERGFRKEDVAAARADLKRAEGELAEAEARYRERQVMAPAAAVVEVMDVRPGDLVAPNAAIALLLERDQIYIRIYVPETRIGLVRLGQRAEVSVDSFPGRIFTAEVEQINQKAEFLPRNVQTREERVHQVVGVKLRIHDPEGVIRPGMAADVKMRVEER
jgi:multidrug resistance efflux pump